MTLDRSGRLRRLSVREAIHILQMFIVGLSISISQIATGSEDDLRVDDLRALKIPEEAREQWIRTVRLGLRVRRAYYWVGDDKVGERMWYENGVMAEERLFRKEVLHGFWREFYPSEKLFCEIPYRDGKLDGVVRYWDKDGQVLSESSMKNGTGNWRRYRLIVDKVSLIDETDYVDGTKHGIEKSWVGLSREKSQPGYSLTRFVNGLGDGWTIYRDYDGRFMGSYYQSKREDAAMHGIERMLTRTGTNKPGHPKYWLDGEEATEAAYLKAAETDAVLKISLESDGRDSFDDVPHESVKPK